MEGPSNVEIESGKPGPWRRILVYACFAAGVLCALAGLACLILEARFPSGPARAVFLASSGSLLLMALPALALPWSARLARGLLAADLTLFALAMLWLGFGTHAAAAPIVFRAAAVGFAVLLALRIAGAVRRATKTR